MIIITGGGSGIGQALAYQLARRQKKVLVVGRRQDKLSQTAAFSPLIDTFSTDISQTKGQQALIARLNEQPDIQALVNNAGIIDPIVPITQLDKTDLSRSLDTHVFAPLKLIQGLIKQLTCARVLNISSGAAYFPVAGWTAYCVSKAALSMLTRCWQLTCPNLAVADVMPGIVDTPMQGYIRQSNNMSEEKINYFKQLKQQNRLLTVDTVAVFLTWLLLDVDHAEFSSQVWDIYDQTHHPLWCDPPHQVPDHKPIEPGLRYD